MSEAAAIDLFNARLKTDGKLIDYVVSKARFPTTATFGSDDIRASALRSFYKAVVYYNGDRTFAGFYVTVAMNDLANYFRANAHAVQLPYNKRDCSMARRVALDAQCKVEGFSVIDWVKVSHDDPVHDAFCPESIAELTDIFSRTLPKTSCEILKSVCGIGCAPKSALAMARVLGVTHQAVQCRITRARERLLRTPAFLRWVEKEYGLSFRGRHPKEVGLVELGQNGKTGQCGAKRTGVRRSETPTINRRTRKGNILEVNHGTEEEAEETA